MGIMICPIHGRSGFVETCSHIASKVRTGALPLGHRFDWLGHLFVCDECFHSLGFEKCSGLKDLDIKNDDIDDGLADTYEAAYNAIEDRDAFCSKCFAELERKQKSQ
jgi:hypothetical protein